MGLLTRVFGSQYTGETQGEDAILGQETTLSANQARTSCEESRLFS